MSRNEPSSNNELLPMAFLTPSYTSHTDANMMYTMRSEKNSIIAVNADFDLCRFYGEQSRFMAGELPPIFTPAVYFPSKEGKELSTGRHIHR